MSVVLPLLVGLIPLLILPGILFHYDITPKVATLALMMAAGLALPGQIAIGVAELARRKSGRWLLILAAAQAAWFTVATSLSSRPWFSLFGSNWRRMGLLTIYSLMIFVVHACAHLCRKPGALTAVLRSFAVAGIVASLYGIAQYFDIDPLQAVSAYHAEAGNSTIVRPPGTLGHAVYFGWWLAVALFCAVGLARTETGAWRSVALSACGLTGAAILMTGTRSAILGAVAGFLSLAFWSGFKPGRRHVVAGLLLIAVLVAFYFSPAGTRLRARVRWSGDEPLGGARPLLWRDALRMSVARPLVGFGPETFASEFPRYQSAELARMYPDFYHESPHNTPLDALTSEGIPGLLIALGWMGLGGYAAIRVRHKESKLSAALAAALVASCVASMFGVPTLGPVFATLLVIAMLVAMDPPDAGARGLIHPVAVLAVSVPAVVGLAVFGLVLAVSDFRLERFQRGSQDTARSIVLYHSAVRMALPGAAEDLYCSRRLTAVCSAELDPVIRAECARTATQAAGRATTSADNPPNAWYNLAMFAAAQGDTRGVESALKKTSALSPNWFKPHWALANLLEITGRRAEARGEAERAAFLDAGKDNDVNQTLRKLTAQSP
jgi:hypothetical protein